MTTSPKRLYKFGRTSSEDILERFDVETHYKRNWRNVPLAQDYNIKPLWSTWVLKREAIDAEKWFQDTFPKNFYSDILYNGIRECREWELAESHKFFQALEERYPKTTEYWENIEKLKLERKLYKVYNKIYYIMLTKK